MVEDMSQAHDGRGQTIWIYSGTLEILVLTSTDRLRLDINFPRRRDRLLARQPDHGARRRDAT